MSIPLYNPAGVEVSINRDRSFSYPTGNWAAARWAIIRSGVHKDQMDRGRVLHPMYHSFHECPDLKLKKELADSTLEDVFDALTTLDRIDGGVSVLFQCPGYPVSRDVGPENMSVDTFCTPYLVDMEGMQERLAYMIQGFGDHVAIPHLRRFAMRYASDSKKPGILPYSSAEQLHIQGPAHLPSFESAGSGNSSLSDIMHFELEDTCNAGENLDSSTFPHTPKREMPLVSSHSQHENPAIVYGTETTNLQVAAIISIGEKTNKILDHFGIADTVIPRLRKLVCTIRSSRWEEVLHSPKWGLTTAQAKLMSKALLADITQESTKQKVGFYLLLYY
ncbi:hypothetical protein F5887DRAFT_1081200 [Amanita rubescens]|nr:hypothetical protein F5887DRAFT_1081200 [Amanita rubescens]